MRIAQIMLAPRFGGAERSFVDLCRALAARGHAVLALGESRGEALRHLEHVPGVEIDRVRCRGPWDRWCRRALERRLAGFAPDLVQAHLARAALHGGAAAKRLGLPTVAKTHNLVKTKYYRDIDVLVPTTGEQAAWLERHGVSAARLERIPNFSALPAAAGPRAGPSGRVSICAAGRFVPKKGFDVLLDALASPALADRDVSLAIAGDGPQRRALEAQAARLGLAKRVHFAGWVDDIAGFLAGADLFVLPSREEPFGIALLEAMSAGLPIVTTAVSGPLEVLDRDTATFCPPDDAGALARALVAVLNDPAAARARAGRALERYEREYSENAVVARYLALYERLTGAARA